MSNEFPIEELYACDRCGTELPGDLMAFMDNGEVLCPDCYDDVSQDSILNSAQNNFIPLGVALDYAFNRLRFIRNLPPDLGRKFISSLNSGIDPLADPNLMRQTKGLKIKNFNAIVVKTANTNLSSICCMGIVFVRDGKIIGKYHSLVRPEPDYYQWHCQSAPWMKPEDTKNAPTFKKAWNKIRNNLKDDEPFVAYNASLTEQCMKTAFNTFKMEDRGFLFCDILKASKNYFGQRLPDFRLKTVASACGYELSDNHNAIDEAEACAAITLRTMPVSALL